MEELSRMTLEEIAKEIGISRTTIYKVLKNKGNVSEETCRIVNEALEKYHYVENRNARNLAMNRHYTIGYVGFQSKSANYFSAEIRKGLYKAVKEFSDDGLSLLIQEFDVEQPADQLKAVKAMLKQEVDSFILAYSDEGIMRKILKLLSGRDCRYVLLSRDIKTDEEHYYVGVDYERSGRLAAELLGKMLPAGRIYIPVTREYRTNQDIRARLKGFQDKIKDYPALELLPVEFDLVEEERIAGAVREKLHENPDALGIFDLTYRLDVIAEVLCREQRREVALIGFDLFEEIRQYVADSTIDAVIYQDLPAQSRLAVKLLFDEMCYEKGSPQKKRYARQEIIMQENLQDFVE